MDIKIGTMIQVGLKTLVVDDICQETGILFCLDNDGEDFEIRESQIDHISPWDWDNRDSQLNTHLGV